MSTPLKLHNLCLSRFSRQSGQFQRLPYVSKNSSLLPLFNRPAHELNQWEYVAKGSPCLAPLITPSKYQLQTKPLSLCFECLLKVLSLSWQHHRRQFRINSLLTLIVYEIDIAGFCFKNSIFMPFLMLIPIIREKFSRMLIESFLSLKNNLKQENFFH